MLWACGNVKTGEILFFTEKESLESEPSVTTVIPMHYVIGPLRRDKQGLLWADMKELKEKYGTRILYR
jgi:hypothetical protein